MVCTWRHRSHCAYTNWVQKEWVTALVFNLPQKNPPESWKSCCVIDYTNNFNKKSAFQQEINLFTDYRKLEEIEVNGSLQFALTTHVNLPFCVIYVDVCGKTIPLVMGIYPWSWRATFLQTSVPALLQHTYLLYIEHLDYVVQVCLIRVGGQLCWMVALKEQGWRPLSERLQNCCGYCSDCTLSVPSFIIFPLIAYHFWTIGGAVTKLMWLMPLLNYFYPQWGYFYR